MSQNNTQTNSSIKLFYGKNFPRKEIFSQALSLTFHEVSSPEEMPESPAAILLFDKKLASEAASLSQWRKMFAGALLVISEDPIEDGDFLVPAGWPLKFTEKSLEAAIRELTLHQSRHFITGELAFEQEKLSQLTKIGIAISAETDLDRLLTLILTEGRKLASCDAASLFLVDKKDPENPQLVFKLTQNDSISFPFKEQMFPINKQSISGFVTVTGGLLSIPDVYQIPESRPYSFNPSFDKSMNYRSRSMLTIAMKNHTEEVIGVLQFINSKTNYNVKLTSPEITIRETRPFPDDLTIYIEALASLAAMAIQNATLIKNIHDLFEGFVSASVTAIEQRDPTTSGHSFRVAEFTTNLALALPNCSIAKFKKVHFTDTQIREIRYASLLHDFGKVGVSEPVLIKAKKLSTQGLKIIWHRFALYKEQLRRQAMEKRLQFILNHGIDEYRRNLKEFEETLREELQRFTQFYEEISQANEPTILPEGRFSHLEQIRELAPFEADNRQLKLLTKEEFLALSVRKGSLTEEERKEIESHVVHTFDFLNQIPWTSDLQNIPVIAVAHHEKLNGSGYPYGLHENDIPLPSKLMTIADIYDALTASDRPYKKALPVERALNILEMESKANLLDKELVSIFIEAKIYEKLTYAKPSPARYQKYSDRFFKRNVCDYDLPDN